MVGFAETSHRLVRRPTFGTAPPTAGRHRSLPKQTVVASKVVPDAMSLMWLYQLSTIFSVTYRHVPECRVGRMHHIQKFARQRNLKTGLETIVRMAYRQPNGDKYSIRSSPSIGAIVSGYPALWYQWYQWHQHLAGYHGVTVFSTSVRNHIISTYTWMMIMCILLVL